MGLETIPHQGLPALCRSYVLHPAVRDRVFRKLNYSVDYVGNPSVDSVAYYKEHQAIPKDTFIKEEGLANKPILALLSGSRKQEIKDNLPTMLKVASAYPDYQPVIAGAPGIDPAYYQEYIGSYPAKIVFGKTYPLLQHSAAALVTSGTATLETALFRVPQVVCYYVVAGQLASFISSISSIRNTYPS